MTDQLLGGGIPVLNKLVLSYGSDYRVVRPIADGNGGKKEGKWGAPRW